MSEQRVTIYSKETGKPYNRFADTAAEMVASGLFTERDPREAIPAPIVPVETLTPKRRK